MRVINLAGGPGSGKSTTAAGLFNLMKCAGLKCELVTEVAKDLTYEKSYGVLNNQLLVFANQDHRIRRLKGQVDYVVTDSPLYIGLAYAEPGEFGNWFENLTYEVMRQYDNKFFFINRVKEYHQYGRTQTEEAARFIDGKVQTLTALFSGGDFDVVDGDEIAPIAIFERLFPRELADLRGNLARVGNAPSGIVK